MDRLGVLGCWHLANCAKLTIEIYLYLLYSTLYAVVKNPKLSFVLVSLT